VRDKLSAGEDVDTKHYHRKDLFPDLKLSRLDNDGDCSARPRLCAIRSKVGLD
jgi:hypothetical protein